MDYDSASENEYDSDRELQVALKQGLIKGLVAEAPEPEKKIYNEVGLNDALSRLRNGLPWIERLDLTVVPIAPPKVMLDQIEGDPDSLEKEEDIHNEFKRELKFYRLAQAAVRTGIPKLHALQIVTKRPDDYLAEMAKDDRHMDKIRSKLQSIQVAQVRSEKAKKLRELRLTGKKVQQEVLQRKQKEKKEMLDAVKKYRKGQLSSLDFIDKPNNKDGRQKKDGKGTQHTPNKKRELKNKKFGFGGQKKRSKYNTKESTNDVSGSFKSFRSSKGGNAKGKKNRPGKQRRQNARSKK